MDSEGSKEMELLSLAGVSAVEILSGCDNLPGEVARCGRPVRFDYGQGKTADILILDGIRRADRKHPMPSGWSSAAHHAWEGRRSPAAAGLPGSSAAVWETSGESLARFQGRKSHAADRGANDAVGASG